MVRDRVWIGAHPGRGALAADGGGHRFTSQAHQNGIRRTSKQSGQGSDHIRSVCHPVLDRADDNAEQVIRD